MVQQKDTASLPLLVDHVGIAGRSLEALRGEMARLGFYNPPVSAMDTGLQAAHASRNSHYVLDNGYVECIASSGGDHLSEYVQRREGLHILAIGVADADRAHERFADAGLRPKPVAVASRPAAHGQLTGTAVFAWFGFESDAFREGLVCAVEHRTPELIYQPGRYVHPNGAVTLGEVLFVTDDLDRAAERYAKLISPVPAANENGAGLTAFDLAAFRARFPLVPPDWPAYDHYAGLVVKVRDENALAELLERNGVACGTNERGERYVVSEALGSVIAFQQSGAV